MGVSTDGEISYGIAFDEDYSFPWDDEQFEGDIDNWWLDVNGYKPPFELYDEQGEYINGVIPSNEVIKEYFDHQRAFEKDMPALPVELVNVCSNDYPMYILAVQGIGMIASRGYPKAFDPDSLVVTADQQNALREFCKAHGIDIEGNEPGWYLSSYYG